MFRREREAMAIPPFDHRTSEMTFRVSMTILVLITVGFIAAIVAVFAGVLK